MNWGNDTNKCVVMISVESDVLASISICLTEDFFNQESGKKELFFQMKFNLTNCIFDSKWLLQYRSLTDTHKTHHYELVLFFIKSKCYKCEKTIPCAVLVCGIIKEQERLRQIKTEENIL